MASDHTEEHWIHTPGGCLYAKSWRPQFENKAPLVLLHNSLGCVALWKSFPERLAMATNRRVVAYDRLGFGRSDASADLLHLSFIEDEARGDFGAVCRQLGLKQFVVLGHSVGAGMAIGCAVAHPLACTGVITVAGQAYVDGDVVSGIRAAELQFANADQVNKLKKHHGEKASWALKVWIGTWLSHAFKPWSLDNQLPQVHCPLLVLHGDHDEYCSVQHPARIAERVSGPARLHLIKDCGHAPHLEHTDAVLTAISAFLA